MTQQLSPVVQSRLWRPAVVWTGVLLAALALGVAGALVLNQSSPPPSAAPFDEIQQSASARGQGVTIEALGASYSGTETILRLRLTVEDEEAILDRIGTGGPVRRVVLSGTGYSGPFDGSPMTSTANQLGELLVHLPPVQMTDTYDGTVELRISELTIQLDHGSRVLQGEWTLPLKGPAVAAAASQLRVEHLASSELVVAGGNATITGVRSRSETRISISLPAGVLMLSQPLLDVDGERLAPRSFNVQNGQSVASFAPTDFGKAVVLHLGAIAEADEQQTATFVLDFEELLSRVGEADTFDIPADLVLDGPQKLLVEGEQGEYSDRPWVGLVVLGNWHPDNGQPVVTDANGATLDLAHVQVEYQKDANGNVLEGTTAIGFFVDGDVDLSRVAIVLGSRSAIDRTPYSATLVPTSD